MTDSQAILVRQPLFNLKREVTAYEMIFRTPPELTQGHIEHDLLNSTRVIVSSMCHFGLASILGKADGYIHVSPALLQSDTLELLPAQRFMLQIPLNTEFSDVLLERCKALKEKGFRFAVQNSAPCLKNRAVLGLMDIVRLDLNQIPSSSLFGITKSVLAESKVEFLGASVDTEEKYRACADLGFSLLQGSVFSNPPKVNKRKAHSQQNVLFRIISELFNEGRISELELQLKLSPELIVRLLRLVNSVGISGGRVQIMSLRQALVALGQKQLLRWVMLMIYTENGEEANTHLIYRAIQRARFMEILTQNANFSQSGLAEQAHLVGMLSLIKDLLDIPLSVLLDEIGLAENLKAAIINQEGVLGQVLKLTIALEEADLAQVESLRLGLGVLTTDISSAQLLAIQWANDLSQKMS